MDRLAQAQRSQRPTRRRHFICIGILVYAAACTGEVGGNLVHESGGLAKQDRDTQHPPGNTVGFYVPPLSAAVVQRKPWIQVVSYKSLR